MARWLFSLMLIAAAAPPLELAVDPRPGKVFTATLAGSAPGAVSGEFRGSLSLNGSAAEMPLVARADRIGERLRLTATLRYEDVPADWVDHLKVESFDYRVRGEVAGSTPVSWTGTLPWNQVSVSGNERTLSGFIELTSLELTALSLRHSEGRAVLAIANPFSFPLTISAASYRLRINGDDIGGGTLPRARILHARKRSALELPFTVDHGRFLAAAGFNWAVGASLDSQIDVSLSLHLASRDLTIPLKLSGRMGTDGARSGVFSLPEGGTSLSPR